MSISGANTDDMLLILQITNYALIDQLVFAPVAGLNIVTGETGAGKSVMLGALELLRGKRADASVLRDKTRKAVVEGVFDISGCEDLTRWLDEHGFDVPEDGRLPVRRELAPTGRSRAFINDTPATLSGLAEMSTMLLDIHSQHSTHTLARPRTRLEVIDTFVNDKTIYRDYKSCFDAYVKKLHEVTQLREAVKVARERRAMAELEAEDLRQLDLKPGAYADLQERFDIQSRARQIKDYLSSAVEKLSADTDTGAIAQTRRVESAVRKAGVPVSRGQDSYEDRLARLLVEMEDIASDLQNFYDRIDDDAEALDDISRRLDLIYGMQLKYKVATPDDLCARLSALEAELAVSHTQEEALPSAERELKELASVLKEKAQRLTEVRREAAGRFSVALTEKGRGLGLPNLKFEARLDNGRMSVSGADRVEFLCSFNKNGVLMPLEQTASGGEISRVMLAIKAIVAGHMMLPTVVLDEIDTGISGEIATLMGRMMLSMSKVAECGVQVIAITHLPQVAACGHVHFYVYKEDTDAATHTRLTLLDEEGHRREVARMLSGTTLDNAALAAADSLIREGRATV